VETSGIRGLILQPQGLAPPGLLGGWAATRGIDLDLVELDRGEEPPEPGQHRFAIVLGSTSSLVGAGPSWGERLLAWLRAADAVCLPVLGICFGAQALAAALGGAVHRLPRPEIGWITVETADGDRLPSGPWMSWHEDGITPPPLAYELARNDHGVQAYCLRRHLAVQFHPEVTPAIVSGWADGEGHAMALAGLTRAELDAATAASAQAAAAQAMKLFDGFAARAGLPSPSGGQAGTAERSRRATSAWTSGMSRRP
jgi:GMP synthase-like glutamine amidotransferase